MWGRADTLRPGHCLEGQWPLGLSLPRVSTASLPCGSRSSFCYANTLRGAPSVRAGGETTSDFLPAYLCFGPICQMAMPVQVKAAWLPILPLPLASCGCGLGHRPPPTSVCSAVECRGWRIARDATWRALQTAPAWRSDRTTERFMITMCGVRGLTLRSNLFFLSLPSFWGIPHWTRKFSAPCSWKDTGVQKLSPLPRHLPTPHPNNDPREIHCAVLLN